MQNFGYIYLTKNLLNGIGYVGQHRGAFNPRYLGSSKAIKKLIRTSGRGIFSVEVIEWCDSQPDLDQSERDHIAILRAFGSELYNISDGGQAIPFGLRPYFLGKKFTQSHRDKISKGNIGRITSDETKAKIRARGFSKEHREKISLAAKNRKYTEAELARLRAVNIGRKWTEQQRSKIIISRTGRPCPPEVREKISAAQRGDKCTPERRMQLSQNNMGKAFSETHKANLREARARYFKKKNQTHVSI